MKKCKYCKKEIDKDTVICPYCKQRLKISKVRLIISTIIIVIVFVIMGIFAKKVITYFSDAYSTTDYKNIEDYQELDIIQLQTEYEENEMNAKKKYSNNYYYFTGEIESIEDNIFDDEITFRYYYNPEHTKQMEVYAHFANNYNGLSNLKTGDTITVYCKFYDRIIDNYAGVTSGYSFKSCQIF